MVGYRPPRPPASIPVVVPPPQPPPQPVPAPVPVAHPPPPVIVGVPIAQGGQMTVQHVPGYEDAVEVLCEYLRAARARRPRHGNVRNIHLYARLDTDLACPGNSESASYWTTHMADLMVLLTGIGVDSEAGRGSWAQCFTTGRKLPGCATCRRAYATLNAFKDHCTANSREPSTWSSYSDEDDEDEVKVPRCAAKLHRAALDAIQRVLTD